VAVHCDGRLGSAFTLMTAALLHARLFPAAREAAAWLRLLHPDPAAAAAAARAAAQALAGGGVLATRSAEFVVSAAIMEEAEVEADAASEASPLALASILGTGGAGTVARRWSVSFSARPASPPKSASPPSRGSRRRASDGTFPPAAEGGGDGEGGAALSERLVWRRTPSGSRARLTSSYDAGGGGAEGAMAFAASAPELVPSAAAAAGFRPAVGACPADGVLT
jgi:hypothetical protein